MNKIFSWFKKLRVIAIEYPTNDDVAEMRKEGIKLLHEDFLKETGLPRDRTVFHEDRTDPNRMFWFYKEKKDVS